MASKNYYLVDTENVGTSWKHLLSDKAPKDEIIIFYTDNSPYISYADMCEILKYPDSFRTMKCYTGRDALDFQLDSYLGFLLKSAPKANYYIVSNDNGYESICRFWGDLGYSVYKKTAADIIKAATQIHNTESEDNPDLDKSIISDNTDSSNCNDKESSVTEQLEYDSNDEDFSSTDSISKNKSGFRRKSQVSRKDPDSPSSTHKPKKVSTTSEPTPSAITVYIPEQYRTEVGLESKLMVIVENSDITKLQPLYNTFIKQFGQVKGLDLYKSIKSHLRELKKEIEETK